VPPSIIHLLFVFLLLSKRVNTNIRYTKLEPYLLSQIDVIFIRSSEGENTDWGGGS